MMKNCLPFLAIKEMQFKVTLRFHLTSQNGYHQEKQQEQQKENKQQMLVRIWAARARNPYILLLGM
jgi:hypothetical protein